MAEGVAREASTLKEHNYVLDKVSKTVPNVIAMIVSIAGMFTRTTKYMVTASFSAFYAVLKHTIIVPIVSVIYIMWVSVVLVPSRPFLYMLDVKQPTSLNDVIEMAVHVQFFVTHLTHYFMVAFIFGAIVGVVTGYNLRFVHYILTPSSSSKATSQLAKVPTQPKNKGSSLVDDAAVEYETSPRKLPRRPARPIRIRSDSEENFASNLSSVADESENTSTAAESSPTIDEESIDTNAYNEHSSSPVKNIPRNLEGGVSSSSAQRNNTTSMNTGSIDKKYLFDQDRLHSHPERKSDADYLRNRKSKRDSLYNIPSSPIMEENENIRHKIGATLTESDQSSSGSNVAAVPVSSISRRKKDEKKQAESEVPNAEETDPESTTTKNELFSTLEREGDINTLNTIASDVLTSETGIISGGGADKSSGSKSSSKVDK
ncbi:Piso0_001564 [Millerozyma farinosa CBS 7064]|uniref:Piso0_001564 protein n=1 Tax=Pichia sorbitophila (strain ATCC MYA-4447 / BCRC 22081 / CBS 7064 / NBRC 10061 / NRRL Y-12695) TaxID=559304 RepID=G8YNH9_PICSO|nr:Piso0_001564 [Millerozyma farinosa CBS 7064]